MSLSRRQIQQKFQQANNKRNELPQVPRSIQQYLQFMDYKIRKQLQSFTILSLCGGADRGNFIVEKQFSRAFDTLALEEKTEYFCNYIDLLFRGFKQNTEENNKQPEIIKNQPVTFSLNVGKGSKSLEQAQITIDQFKVRTKGKGIPDLDLRNYMIRKSKKKNMHCYVLQAIKTTELDTVRFSFLSKQGEAKYLSVIRKGVHDGLLESLKKQIGSKPSYRKKQGTFKLAPIDQKSNQNSHQEMNTIISMKKQKPDLNKSVIQDIVKRRQDQQLDDSLTEFIHEQNEKYYGNGEKKSNIQYNRNIFKILLPNYYLKDLSKLHHYGSIYQSLVAQQQLFIYLSMKDHSELKMQFSVDLPQPIVCKAIYNVQLYKYWHPEVDEGQIKLKISSENSCILYLKTKAYSEWYKERDYLFLAHMFKIGNDEYIGEKSIQNTNFIPFQSITRGKFDHVVWKVEQDKSNLTKESCKVKMQIKINHQGLLNHAQQKELSIRFLKGFQNLQQYYRNVDNQNKLTDILSQNWLVSEVERDSLKYEENPHNQLSLRTCDFDDGSQISEELSGDQIFYSFEDLSDEENILQQEQKKEPVLHEIVSKKQIQFKISEEMEKIKLNQEGLVILPKQYLKKKQIMSPISTQPNLMKLPYESVVLKDHWVLQKKGGLKLIHQGKIDAQNNVIKFIMATLKKNLFSGKGILNISLPVQIFNVDSNLQRVCSSLTLGPTFLQPVAKINDHIQRFRRVIAFGLSNSIIYFDVEKPFNPILGQTYQGYINGCPIYAEQISHHPPITSIYFIGRGYKITANLEAKVHVKVNSGDGVNQGFNHVIFDDGHEILYQTPPAQLSGLAVGQRRFNFGGKGYYLDLKNELFCEMKFQSGGFFSKKKSEYIDEIQGEIVQVKPEFLRKFVEAKLDKKPSLSEKDIIQRFDKLSGRWPIQLRIGEKVYYNIYNDIPQKLVDQVFPLNSNSNYREDLLYRKKNDLSRSQIEKQRLQVIQRKDRKLREKFHGPAH